MVPRRKQAAAAISTDTLTSELQARQSHVLFPLDVFEHHTSYINELLSSGLQRNAIGPSMLAALATAIGSGARFSVPGKKWTGFCNLYLAVVGASGAGKSPVDGFVFSPIHSINREITVNNQEDERKQLVVQEVKLVTLKQDVLKNNPRGVIKFEDELRVWVETIDKEQEGTFWLSAWDGKGYMVNRKNAQHAVPFACVTVYGGTQPSCLPVFFQNYRDTDGFTARMLFSFLERNEWAPINLETEISDESQNSWDNCIQDIFQSNNRISFEDDPDFYSFDSQSLKIFTDWQKNKKNEFTVKKTSPEVYSPLMSKMSVYVLKFSLIMSIYRRINSRFAMPEMKIILDDIKKAIQLANYFIDNYLTAMSLCISDNIPAEIRMIANMLNNGISLRKVAQIVGKDHSNIAKRVKEWQMQYPLVFIKSK